MAAYAAAIAGAPLPIGLGRAESGSVNAAVLSYLASNLFKALKSPETKKVHRATLERFAAKYGSLSFRTLDKIGVERVLAKIAETPGAARNLRNVLRRMMKWAVAEGILASNPTEGIKVVMPKSDGWHTMTDAEREQYRTHHPIGTKARAAFELFFYTALRCSDACRLGPQHIVGSTLRLKQQKTGELVELPVGQETVDNVAPLAFLLTHQGRPYTAKGLGNAVKDWCRTAGIPHCSAHTIRKSTLTLLADKGRTMHEIAAYGGHRSLRMVETYTKKANQLHLARAAAKAFEDESRTEMSTVPVEGYTKEKKA